MGTFLKIILFVGIATCSVSAKLKCLPVTSGTSPPICGENEEFSTCGSLCSEAKCPRYGFEELLCPAVCNEGCFCAPGFVRDPNGKCVSLEQCPTVTCPINQHFDNCGAACEPTCDNPVLLFCPLICMPGCVCDEGFVKNSEGECVRPSKCPPRQCAQNEEYLEMGSPCEPTCSIPGTFMCKAASRPGCFCQKGYVRDDNGQCILAEECPKVECNGPNEFFNECGSTCGDLTCDVPDFAAVTCAAGCGRGCYCQEGFVRNYNNECVPREQCEPVGHCPANEDWNDCGPPDGCEATCDPLLPDRLCADFCVAKCVCKENYVRDVNGNCIPRDDCPKPECGEHEVYTECGSGCGDLSCEIRDFSAVSCPAVCVKGCFCAEGYVRDSSGKCITVNECPSCPEKERYTQCGAMCAATCANPNPFICPAICMPGCICDFGLVRNSEGQCVEPSECPRKECGEHEHYTDCGSICGDLTCTMQSYAAVLCPAVCNAGCFCDEGYVRDSEGVCVLPSTCPNHGCKENEEWTDCGPVDSCEGTCKNPDVLGIPCPDVCVEKCVCKEGYVRDANYNCVPRDTCSAVVCDEHEIYTQCGSGCGDPTCDQQDFKDRFCPAVCRVGCFCEPGYVRSPQGKCVLPDECKNVHCGANEEYQDCGVGGCQNTCENPMLQNVCDPIGCVPGCYCQEGFFKNSNGECVTAQDCPAVECGTNQEFKSCGFGGCENTCENPELSTMCLPAGCIPGCYCLPGYVKIPDGECVMPDKCPSIECGPHQEFSKCGANGCENSCENPNFAQVCKGMCIGGCICSEGYIRNSKGDCILPSECPNHNCGTNQHYDVCGVNGCENTCAQPDLESVCRNIRCQEGCYCDKGFIRAPNGECVLPENCPRTCGENEEYFPECGPGACENTCTQPEKQLVCKAKCEPGCFCSQGYVRNEKTEQCVPVDSCHDECGKNEHYTDCGSGCGDLTCETRSFEDVFCPAVCFEGCVCNDGFVRHDGQCINPKSCPRSGKPVKS